MTDDFKWRYKYLVKAHMLDISYGRMTSTSRRKYHDSTRANALEYRSPSDCSPICAGIYEKGGIILTSARFAT